VRVSPPEAPLTDGTIVLRQWSDADVPAIVAACGDAEIARWLDQVPQPYTERDAREYVASTRRGWREASIASFAIAERRTNEQLGSVSVHWLDHEHAIGEVGYWVRADARGRGVATRAVRLVSRWAIEECKLERLQLRADVHNEASQRVAEKAGFRREGVLRSARYSPRQGRRVDFVVFSLLPEELACSGH
jgi:RimJ/RimL family protein N-acetyltransferase